MYLSIHDNPPNIANNLIASKYIILISILSITFNCVSLYPPNIANNLIGGKYITLISKHLIGYLSIDDNPPNIANNLIASKCIILILILSITFNCVSLYSRQST